MKVFTVLSVLVLVTASYGKRPSRTAAPEPTLKYATTAEASASHADFAHAQHAKLIADHQQKRLHSLAFGGESQQSAQPQQFRLSSQLVSQQQERVKAAVGSVGKQSPGKQTLTLTGAEPQQHVRFIQSGLVPGQQPQYLLQPNALIQQQQQQHTVLLQQEQHNLLLQQQQQHNALLALQQEQQRQHALLLQQDTPQQQAGQAAQQQPQVLSNGQQIVQQQQQQLITQQQQQQLLAQQQQQQYLAQQQQQQQQLYAQQQTMILQQQQQQQLLAQPQQQQQLLAQPQQQQQLIAQPQQQQLIAQPQQQQLIAQPQQHQQILVQQQPPQQQVYIQQPNGQLVLAQDPQQLRYATQGPTPIRYIMQGSPVPVQSAQPVAYQPGQQVPAQAYYQQYPQQQYLASPTRYAPAKPSIPTKTQSYTGDEAVLSLLRENPQKFHTVPQPEILAGQLAASHGHYSSQALIQPSVQIHQEHQTIPSAKSAQPQSISQSPPTHTYYTAQPAQEIPSRQTVQFQDIRVQPQAITRQQSQSGPNSLQFQAGGLGEPNTNSLQDLSAQIDSSYSLQHLNF